MQRVAREPLSKGARDFISAYIHSVRQLELLLLLRERRQEPCSAAAVASALRVAPAWAAAQMDSMHASGLLELHSSDDSAYRYAASPADDRLVDELDESYRRRKQTVIQAILGAMGSDVQALSDAFRIRKPRDG